MTPLTLEDLVLPAIVSVIHAYQLGTFARRVGAARSKFKVPPPETTGDPIFARTLRAQQDAVEFSPMFYSMLWSASLFCNPVPSTIAGICYIIGRQRFFQGYVQNPEKRGRPFAAVTWSLKTLFALSVAGMLGILLRHYAGITVKKYILYPILIPATIMRAKWL